LMVNCAYNAISGIAQAPYADLAALGSIRDLQHAVVEEVCALAAAEGIELPLASSLEAMERIAAAMPAQLSSTAQDMARGKPSEIDHLNGFVVRRGREVGVRTPANLALYALVRLVESRRRSA
jgi:2-dehydropantoate 2-reductase